MGLWNDFWDGLTSPVAINPMICRDKKLAGTEYCKPVNRSWEENIIYLVGELDILEESLMYAEYVPDFRDYAHKIAELRGAINEIQDKLTTLTDLAGTYQEVKNLRNALKLVAQADPRSNPEAAAKAYGAAMKSLGNLISKLPGVFGAFGTLIAEMGGIFATVVGNIVPHLKGTHRRVDEQVMQGGDRSIWEKL